MVEEEDTLHLCNDEVRELMGRVPPPPFGEAHALGTDPPGTRRDTRTGIVPERLRDGMAQVCRVTLTDEVRRSRDNGCASRHPPRGMGLPRCTLTILDGISDAGGKNAVRVKCSAALEDMKLKWGRYEIFH